MEILKRPHFSTREEMCIFHDNDYVKYLELVGEKVENIGVNAAEINDFDKNQLYNDTKKCKYFLLRIYNLFNR